MTDIESKAPQASEKENRNGQSKCPKCGATDISLSVKKGVLRCNFCRFEFLPELAQADEDISSLEGLNTRQGAKDISDNAQSLITLKCESCGSEVTVDTSEATSARCHWCRNHLSINSVVENGAVPDAVLPFAVTQNQAKELIGEFVSKRRFFAHPKFKKEFTADNVMGVYLPYMIVDVNAHATLWGEGEHEARRYTVTVGSGKNKTQQIRYDADLYRVGRAFDMEVDDLIIESSSDKLTDSGSNTNNIINSILPFDTENCVKWDANYIRGFTSEKRDLNVDAVRPAVQTQLGDIARHSVKDTLGHYDRGVRWDSEQVEVKGSSWKTAYCPVWLYSFFQPKGNGGLLHYVALNARTKEVMGSVPVNKLKLFLFSLLAELVAYGVKIFVDAYLGAQFISWILLSAGIIFFALNYMSYRNTNERHHHEKLTKRKILNMQRHDEHIRTRHGLSSSFMNNSNYTRVEWKR